MSSLLPATDGTKNSDFRIWGKPIYAMADGTVEEFQNAVPSNPAPLHWTSDADLQAKLKAQQDDYWGSFLHGEAGNHFCIQCGNELVLYAHLQPGSLNPALLHAGAVVHAGEFLGYAGNSGNSTAPHLHIHAIQGTELWQGPPRPLTFRNTYVLDGSALQPGTPNGPWVKAAGQALPHVGSVVWPAATQPTWYPPGWGELQRFGIPEASYQAEFTKMYTSGYRPVFVDAYDVGGQAYFNVIMRPADGVPWVARHGLDGAAYQAEFAKWTGLGYRLAQVDSYLSGGALRYVALFLKAGGPAWTAYHGLTAAQHQARFNALTAQGYVPVNITAQEINGERIYAALYEKESVGSFISMSFLTPAEYQQQFDANVQAGRKLVYLNAYTFDGGPRLIAIWEQNAPSQFVAKHGLSASAYQSEFDAELGNGYLTRAVAGYEQDGQARFAGLWSR
jgi:hypothetical protein